MTQKIKKTLITIVLSALSLSFFAGTSYAAIAQGPTTPSTAPSSTSAPATSTSDTLGNGCTGDDTNSQAGAQKCLTQDPIVVDLNTIVNILAGIVGVAVTGSLIFAGIQYSMAGDSPDATSKAKNRIISSIVALAAFILIYGFMQWIIPGGVFS